MTYVGETSSIFRFGDFTFDCARRVLLRAGMERHLSPKAHQLLYLLIVARPRALSRDELYDTLWPSTFVCETNMAGLVNEIRRALDDDARASQYIRTVHGFGYAFCGQVTPSAPAAFDTAVLVCHGAAYPLYEGENLVGRTPDSRVLIADRAISRHHAVVTVKGGNTTVHDLDSTNGTYVDGYRIGRNPVVVTGRSRIEFGVLGAKIELRKISSTASLHLNLPELKRQASDRLGDA